MAQATETFEAAWQIIHDTYYDTNFNGINWLAVREELRPQACQAPNTAALREVIQSMLDRLGESHLHILPGQVVTHLQVESESSPAPRRSGPGTVGLDVRRVGRDFLVSAVEPQGAAEAAGIKPGWIVQAVDDTNIQDLLVPELAARPSQSTEFLVWASVTQLLKGPAGSTVLLAFRNGQDLPLTLTLERQMPPGIPVKLGYLPTYLAYEEHRALQPRPGIKVGYLRFNVWMLPLSRSLDEAVDELRGSDGFILDLRGNPGGIASMIMGFAGHFLDEEISLGTLKTRHHELQFVANPRRVNTSGQPVKPFAGPLAILVDGLTASASEVFTGGMQALGRARVFGQTTSSQTLPAVFDQLPNGDVLLHAIADFLTPAGERLEGRGVIPDTLVRLSRNDLLAGRDASLEAALDWILSQAPRGQFSQSTVQTGCCQ